MNTQANAQQGRRCLDPTDNLIGYTANGESPLCHNDNGTFYDKSDDFYIAYLFHTLTYATTLDAAPIVSISSPNADIEFVRVGDHQGPYNYTRYPNGETAVYGNSEVYYRYESFYIDLQRAAQRHSLR